MAKILIVDDAAFMRMMRKVDLKLQEKLLMV